MAFRLPQAPPPPQQQQQQQRFVPSQLQGRRQTSRPASLRIPVDQSQEWVLFSPSPDTHTISPTEASPRTAGAGASRLSDFGSLNSGLGHSHGGDEAAAGEGEVPEAAAARATTRAAAANTTDADAADANDDLDSLDDGLHEFREHFHASSSGGRLSHDPTGGTILPKHDGLGSFLLPNQAIQEQLWQHERFNPRRRSTGHHRTTSSFYRRLDAAAAATAAAAALPSTADDVAPEHPLVEGDKLDRIERWRLEQSRVMLEEVRKEARRRKQLRTGGTAVDLPTHDDVASTDGAGQVQYEHGHASSPTAARKGISNDNSNGHGESEGFWQRLTRRVIKDFMGINDSVLSVILGESRSDLDMLSTTPKTVTPDTLSNKLQGVQSEEHLTHGWEDRLLKRLARELNTIVSNLSDQPRTFSTYSRPDNLDFDYAGIPIQQRRPPTIPETEELELKQTPKATPISSDLFSPTLGRIHDSLEASQHDAGWGIEDSEPAHRVVGPEDLEYWERTPDLRQVFAYLSRRFLSTDHDDTLQPPASLAGMASSSATTGRAAPRSVATHPSPDSLRRAAIIRQHHPLVSRAHENRLASQRRSQHQRRPSLRSIAERVAITDMDSPRLAASENGAAAEIRSLKRFGDDCASQSTKRSRTSRSRQHYWDMGSDSAAAALGGMGAWGEV